MLLQNSTGIVHCAPSHGPDDFNLCLNNGIKAIETVDGDGKYTKMYYCLKDTYFKANPGNRKIKRTKKIVV